MSGTDRLCVATFGEDVGWVAESGLEACIYDATGSRPGLISLPNHAREASQYLHHIVTHYGDFRDFEVFLQGDPIPHHTGIMTVLKNRSWRWRRVASLCQRVMTYEPSNSHPHNRAAARFAEDIGINLEPGALWAIGAMFAASREALESRPLAWWRRLQAKTIIEREVSPWAIERLWLRMLQGD